MPEISFAISAEEAELVDRIVARAVPKFPLATRVELEMDITAAHANGCPLLLEQLLNAPDRDFYHDIAGIRRHINRSTGVLEGVFTPRCAANQ